MKLRIEYIITLLFCFTPQPFNCYSRPLFTRLQRCGILFRQLVWTTIHLRTCSYSFLKWAFNIHQSDWKQNTSPTHSTSFTPVTGYKTLFSRSLLLLFFPWHTFVPFSFFPACYTLFTYLCVVKNQLGPTGYGKVSSILHATCWLNKHQMPVVHVAAEHEWQSQIS